MKGKAFLSRLTAFSLAALLILAGCGQPSSAPPAQQQQSSPSAQAPQSQQAAPAGPQRGGVLKISVAGDPGVLGYPAEIRALTDLIVSATTLETLGRYDESGQIQPFLAESWQVDPAAKTITIKLKPGIKFHDGTDFNAAAVKWNLDDFRAKRAELRGVESVAVVDDRTVRINLSAWNNTMLDSIAFFVYMISPTAFEKNGKDWAVKNPVGTGPFQLESWQRDVAVKFKRFDGYWQQGQPYLDGVEWRVIKDPMTTLASFKAKEVDVFTWIPPESAKDLTASGAVVVQNTTGLGARMGGLIANSTDPNSPWGKVQVRKALSYAIDRQAIADSIFHGFATPTDHWGHPNAWSINKDLPGFPYDPDKAKQLLAEAGYPNGFKTTFVVSNNPLEVQWATAVQGFLADIGIDAQIDAADRGRYVQLTSGKDVVWGDGLVTWNSRSDADLAMYMPRVFSSKGVLYTNGIADIPAVDELLAAAQTAPDFETKKNVALELQAAVFDTYALATTLFVQTLPSAKHPYVQGDGFNQTHSSMWTPSTAWLQK